MNRVFLDSSFIIAYVNKNDQNNTKANDLILHFSELFIVTSTAVLLEIGNSLSKNYKKESIDIIDRFYSSDNVEIIQVDEVLFEEGFDIYKRYYDKSWSIVDCISFSIMKNRKIERSLTFDKHFNQAGFQIN